MILFPTRIKNDRFYLATSSVLNLTIAVIIGILGKISSELAPLLIALALSGVLSFVGILKVLMNYPKYGRKVRPVCILSLMHSLSVVSFGIMTTLGLKIKFKTPIEAILFALLIVGGGLLSISTFAFLSYLSLSIYSLSNREPLGAIIPLLLAAAIPLAYISGLLIVYFIVILAIPLAELVLIKSHLNHQN